MKIYGSTIIVTTKYTKCSKCGNPDVDFIPFHRHRDICEYLVFRNYEAKIRNLKSVDDMIGCNKTQIEEELIPALDDCGIEYVHYKIYGMCGRGYDIFIPESVICAIQLYNSNDDFAGLSLAEFIRKVAPDACKAIK